VRYVIDVDVANDPCSAANAAVPAEFAGQLAVERFIGNVGRNRVYSARLDMNS